MKRITQITDEAFHLFHAIEDVQDLAHQESNERYAGLLAALAAKARRIAEELAAQVAQQSHTGTHEDDPHVQADLAYYDAEHRVR